ncbi:PDR/VanB family oxidoreductase [Hydrogenophaga flava]|uniref:PDR/VanB family oxidoreductase n=1 Tax=Hydrogenophaga flava TaxID=65657 RepID=UPI000825AC90|nr:PDR/VanB family oxidoreductase [Hydrogenophaga flava]
MDMTVRGIRLESADVRSLQLVMADGAPLPPWRPGAHVELHLGPGLRRAYSLCNHPGETGCYRIAVKLEPVSRGGSRAVHALQVGQTVRVEAPRHLFELHPEARHHVLLAAGIGLTPLYAMFHGAGGGPAATLHVFARSPAHATFADRLDGHAQWHFGLDGEATAQTLRRIVGEHAGRDATCFYHCGPAPFMAAVDAALDAAGVPTEWRRSEQFSAAPALAQGNADTFTVELARSGQRFTVTPTQSILEAARQHGIDLPCSCEMGVCGACLSQVIEGEPDHRDSYLSPEERAGGRLIMPCVSRCRGARLVLDH